MKKLGKLSINPEKVIKNDELVNLRGGYDGTCCLCTRGVMPLGYIAGSTESTCKADCQAVYGSTANGGWHHLC